MHEALFYERQGKNSVRCGLCRFRCLIANGHRGICNVRENREGTLYSLVYGLAVAEQADPIEKKPLYHFLPGSHSYSIATVGCNFRCRHCQNYAISQPVDGTLKIVGMELPPGEVVKRALASGCRSISYTYTEPTIFFEYAFDTARLAKAQGLKNIFVTNGYISPEPLAAIAPYLDAANIDLKGFTEKFYIEQVQATLAGVLATIRDYRRHNNIWLELTTLLIPGLNDSDKELSQLCRFIAEEVGVDTPWHVSQFFPTYLTTDRQRTPLDTLLRARKIGLGARLRHIYLGNVTGAGGEESRCSACATILIERQGYRITANRLVNGACPFCGTHLSGVFDETPPVRGN
ncbi:MAG TPA: AmmeMemoRadiSam system radical SAM enzyme [Geobacterales bacterium]|nr:AmmeMemoRadiSam system radical SAM enzyme [Geobacterales bacterium]